MIKHAVNRHSQWKYGVCMARSWQDIYRDNAWIVGMIPLVDSWFRNKMKATSPVHVFVSVCLSVCCCISSENLEALIREKKTNQWQIVLPRNSPPLEPNFSG